MSQSHLVIDFPIKAPASAKALTEELPPLMPDLAKVQDELGTVHFSRFMVKGDEKLLFLSDIDGEIDHHIKRLVERADPVFDTIFRHVEDPPATPVASNPERVVKWLKHHIREPLDTYFADEDSSVQDIKAAARAAGFTGNTQQGTLLTYFPIKAPASAKALTEELPPLMPDLAKVQDELGTVHFSRFMVKGDEKLLFLSDIDGEIDDHIKRLVESAGPVFDFILKHVENPPATPVASNPERVIKWLKHHIREPIDTYFAYEDASVQDIKAAARAAGFTGNTQQGTLLTYMAFKSRLQGFALKLVGKA